jgi:hypothetical protein
MTKLVSRLLPWKWLSRWNRENAPPRGTAMNGIMTSEARELLNDPMKRRILFQVYSERKAAEARTEIVPRENKTTLQTEQKIGERTGD